MDTRYATCLADLLAPCPDTGRQPLNEAQHRAVVASDEPQLVLAGPRTGKTRVLVYRAAYLLLRERDRLRPQEVGLFTYTNKAARQLRARPSPSSAPTRSTSGPGRCTTSPILS